MYAQPPIRIAMTLSLAQALAWSPSITHQHLVATGLSTGRTLILSLSPSSLSPTLPLAKLSPVLNVKHSRPVTSLSFSTLDPNYLATGLERHRSDYSLLIWDVSAAVNFTPADTSSSWQRPLDRLEPTHSLGRDTGEIRNIQHYCPAEHIHSVAFIPETINELLASSNNKTIRLYDLRAPGPTGNSTSKDSGSASAAVMQWSTRAVYGIAPDSSHRHLFASWESLPGGSVVRLWDKRRLTGELLSFEVGSGGVLGLEWLGDDRLGVGTSEGVSVWEVVHGQREGEERTTLEAMRSGASVLACAISLIELGHSGEDETNNAKLRNRQEEW